MTSCRRTSARRSAAGLALASLAFLTAGCGEPYRVAPVAGTVRLNGKPLANAYVHFAPIGSRDLEPGPTSQGKTGPDGRYSLRLDVDPPKTGAVIHPSRVFITTADNQGQADAGGKRIPERVPRRYNLETTLTFEVPPGGTDQADFDLTAP